MVLGDFNAKVGKEENNYPYAGRNGLHEACNGNGYKLAQFAAATDMIIGGSIFPHKNIYKVTWRSLNGVTMNQIDHILIKKKHSSNVRDVRCKQGVNDDSDHHLVMAKIQARISMNKKYIGGKGYRNIMCSLWKTKRFNVPSETRLWS
jgi:endonuclease/exonuclease/phosphatase family metal-dependent hydrolase